MAVRKFDVNTGTLKTDVSTIEEEIKGINSGADKLEQALHQLETMWDGSSKQAFSAAVNDDLRKLRELSKALTNFTAKTSEARQEYDKCENAVAQVISSIKV